MHCFCVILLLAGVLAVGQAAPVSSKAQYYYPLELRRPQVPGYFGKQQEVANKEDSFDYVAGARALGILIDAFGKLQEAANKGGSFDYGTGARVLGSLIDTFGKRPEEVASKEMQADAQASWRRILTATGTILG